MISDAVVPPAKVFGEGIAVLEGDALFKYRVRNCFTRPKPRGRYDMARLLREIANRKREAKKTDRRSRWPISKQGKKRQTAASAVYSREQNRCDFETSVRLAR